MRFAPALAAVALAIGLTQEARAQGLSDLPPGATTGDPLTAGIEQRRPFWRGSGPTRGFFAATIDVGALYLMPRGQFGYGKPHYRWFGAEIASAISLASVRGYAGLRGTMAGIFDVRVGARYEHPTSQRYLPPLESYLEDDLDSNVFGHGVYIAGEAEVTTSIPVPSGSIIGVLSGMYLSNIPKDAYLLEQSLRVVVDPPWLWRARIGYLYHLGWQGTMRLGLAAEVIHLVERQAFTIRAGPAVSVALTHHLEALAAIMIVAHSPDALGLAGADLGQLGLRYRWATGDAWAAFP